MFKWIHPADKVTQQPLKVRILGVPPGTELAAALVHHFMPQIQHYRRSQAQRSMLSGLPIYAAHTELPDLKMQYASHYGNERLDIEVSPHVVEETVKKLEKKEGSAPFIVVTFWFAEGPGAMRIDVGGQEKAFTSGGLWKRIGVNHDAYGLYTGTTRNNSNECRFAGGATAQQATYDAAGNNSSTQFFSLRFDLRDTKVFVGDVYGNRYDPRWGIGSPLIEIFWNTGFISAVRADSDAFLDTQIIGTDSVNVNVDTATWLLAGADNVGQQTPTGFLDGGGGGSLGSNPSPDQTGVIMFYRFQDLGSGNPNVTSLTLMGQLIVDITAPLVTFTNYLGNSTSITPPVVGLSS